ncbi:hypothetical protein IJH15_01660 [Candidatus Saccharibacteria bacterium]|nr:hypothetical protein [Candidatus Saccharibacteria bacterium]
MDAATKLYCRKASEFDVFRDFDPADFEFLNFVIEHEDLLTAAGKRFVNRALIHDFRLYQKEVQNGPKGVVLYGYLESVISRYMNNNEGEATLARWRKDPRKKFAEEESKIFSILEESGYIRPEGIAQSVLLSAIVNDASPVKTGEKGLFILDWSGFMESRIDRFYETIKPTTGEELKLISDILSEELTSAQFEVIKHFIFKGWCTYYAYTSAEFENLTTALDNIQEIPNLKNRINEIMDGTLF